MKRKSMAVLSLAAMMAMSVVLAGCNKGGEDTSHKNETPEVQQQRQQKSGGD